MSDESMKKEHSTEWVFAVTYFKEKNGRKAWRKAKPNSKCTDASADTQASRMLKNDKVISYLAELNNELKTDAVMSKIERMEWLSKVIRTPISKVDGSSDLCQEIQVDVNGEKIKMPSKLGAIAELNKMDGAYEPEKKQISFEESLDAILAKAMGVDHEQPN